MKAAITYIYGLQNLLEDINTGNIDPVKYKLQVNTSIFLYFNISILQYFYISFFPYISTQCFDYEIFLSTIAEVFNCYLAKLCFL